MNNREVLRYKNRLDSLFKDVKSVSWEIEVQSHWARYLCILVSGFLETSVRELYRKYARDRANQYIANYVERNLEDFRNPKMERILTITGFFNPEWQLLLRNETEGELKDAVDSIVANRNQIAHGKSTEISLVRIEDYYKRALKVVELIDKQLS